jgi:hypothetical protein
MGAGGELYNYEELGSFAEEDTPASSCAPETIAEE